jgi:hypothetical protein
MGTGHDARTLRASSILEHSVVTLNAEQRATLLRVQQLFVDRVSLNSVIEQSKRIEQ